MDFYNWFASVKELWDKWDLRAMMLLSLFMQIFLVLFGSRRKYVAGIWVGIFVWLAYPAADWVATFALGVLARSQRGAVGSKTNGTDPNPDMIPAFWAPILLLHLGGPDSITAYSVQDNDLWSRHLLQLLTQLLVAVYASLKSWWSQDPLIFVSIPIFISGIIKYGERIWVLRSASYNNFKAHVGEEIELLEERVGFPNIISVITLTTERLDEILALDKIRIPEARYLHEAQFLFQISKSQFVDNLVPFRVHMCSYKLLKNKNAHEAFKLIEVELGFMFDVLFTKVIAGGFWRRRFILRFTSFLSSIWALLVFSIKIMNFHVYSRVDITISYLLLVGAIVLESCSPIFLFFSDWSMLWLSMQRKSWAPNIYGAVHSSQLFASFRNNKRWKGSMAQYNLADGSSTPIFGPVMNWFGVGKTQNWEAVEDSLKESIFNHLLEKRSRWSTDQMSRQYGVRLNDLKEILAERGERVFLREDSLVEDFGWTMAFGKGFHGSLILWHIATDICYHDDRRKGGADYQVHPNCKMSTSLSNYLMYLLNDLPVMLPKGFDEARLRETSKEISKYSGWGSGNPQRVRWSRKFLKKSLLSDGLELAKSLQSLEERVDHCWTNECKWKMISDVWVEMLAYAAAHCGWKEHVQALIQGGELITLVSILMSHLGLNEQCSLPS